MSWEESNSHEKKIEKECIEYAWMLVFWLRQEAKKTSTEVFSATVAATHLQTHKEIALRHPSLALQLREWLQNQTFHKKIFPK